MKRFHTLLLIVFLSYGAPGQSTTELLNLLIRNKTISQDQADSIRSDFSSRQYINTADKNFQISAEYRPRTEYRNGYHQLRNDSTVGAFFINQRTRINLSYTHGKKLAFYFSMQDLRVWGAQDPKSLTATLQVFESWAEPYFNPQLSVRIGRQRLMLDNQRLFSHNDWRLSGTAFDALNFRFIGEKLSSYFILAFNQSKENYFGTDYEPNGFANFKAAAVSYFKYNLSERLVVSAINSAIGYQDAAVTEKMNFLFSDGGRLEYKLGAFYTSLAAYYQWGKNPSGDNLSAWYLQPEIQYNSPFKMVASLGAEFFSGNKPNSTDHTDHSFVSLYGSGHTFNGSMDLITKFPDDVGNAGLVNPYLLLMHPVAEKLDIKANFHHFSLMEKIIRNEKTFGKNLGVENDWLLCYKPSAALQLDLGVSYMLPTETFAVIKGGNYKLTLSWVYLSLSFRPTFFSTVF